ncbi:hypothetical protein AAF712_016834, partial [Marasmius tenuissimus]
MTCAEGDDPAFLEHLRTVFDKRFRLIATPIHKLALFLHPLCRKLVVSSHTSFMLGDLKSTALSLVRKWNWSRAEAIQLRDDIDLYYQIKEPFTGGTADSLEWWKSLPINSKVHPIKSLAIVLHSITPHAAEIERLFSSLNGIQSPCRNNLSVDNFEKLAKLRNHYSAKLWEDKRAAGQSTHRKHSHMHAKDGPAMDVELVNDLDTRITWEPPLDSAQISDPGSVELNTLSEDPIAAAFQKLDERIEEEVRDEEIRSAD